MFFDKILRRGKGNDSPESIVGEVCTVVERIDSAASCGEVRVGANVWSARGASDDDVYEVGERLRVLAVEGVKLICKK